jgi:cyclase
MKNKFAPIALFAVSLSALPASAQQDFSKVEITTQKLADGVWMLTGAGGNIGVSAGDDGVFMIDSQYAPLTDKIRAAIAAVTDKKVRFLLNTHWHGDHTGGNENLGKTGVVIVAQENVRKRMSTEQFIKMFDMKTPPSPAAALPLVTFVDTVSFHVNGDDVNAFHVPPAHTDGDAIVYFSKANVLHMGDTFFNGFYPFVDLSSGGSVAGMIGACDRGLAMGNASTKVIPGHGPLATKAELKAFRDMLAGSRDAVLALVKAGKSLDEVKAAKPTSPWDEKWGKAFVKPEVWATLLYTDLSGNK